MNAKQRLGRFILKNNKAIQFAGYEGGNAWLGLNRGFTQSHNLVQRDFEIAMTLFMLAGSGMIWAMDSKRLKDNPLCLYYGGLSLSLGGVCFAAAGHLAEGIVTTLASLETARGGVKMVIGNYEAAPTDEKFKPIYQMAIFKKLYCDPVQKKLDRIPYIGARLDNQPLLYGSLLKFIFRPEFIAAAARGGDRAGVTIGVGWAIADFTLALCDEKFRNAVARAFGLVDISKPAMPATPMVEAPHP